MKIRVFSGDYAIFFEQELNDFCSANKVFSITIHIDDMNGVHAIVVYRG